MYQGEKCSVIWGGSDALGRLIWVISRKIILIWGFSLSLIVNFFLRELLLLSCFVFLIDDFVWLKKNKPKIRSRMKANSLISRRQLQPSFHEKFLLPIAHYHIITTTKKNNRLIPMILQHDITFFKKKTFKWAFVSLFCIYVHRIIAIYTWYLSSFLVEKCLATSVVWGNLVNLTPDFMQLKLC